MHYRVARGETGEGNADIIRISRKEDRRFEKHRPYRRKLGTLGRVIPHRDFIKYHGDKRDHCIQCGPGAWQVAGRLSGLDLDDGFIQGGKLIDTTLAANWHLNPDLRVTASWVHAFVDDRSVKSDADIFTPRVGFDF